MVYENYLTYMKIRITLSPEFKFKNHSEKLLIIKLFLNP
jgi:hypothetical protein